MIRKTQTKALTNESFWNAEWDRSRRNVRFYPYKPSFVHFHRLFKKYLPMGEKLFFEVGCFPGQHLWYFSKYFGYTVSGIEFLEGKAEKIQMSLAEEGVMAKVIRGDFFKFRSHQQYDIVASFGFVEHFGNTLPVVRKHCEMANPGGLVVITAPNHSSVVYNRLLKLSGVDIYNAHNHMSLNMLISSVRQLRDVDVMASGYIGHLGLGYTGGFVCRLPRVIRLVTRLMFFALGFVTQIIPDNKVLSQAMYVILKKHNIAKG